ncbi:MAG: DUF1572 domain-containing protein, partial [Gemmatimonadetes bacterium]|nr:DUF1572 domain-containing protein [Gemmatimonadota bacterium]NIQ53415.1 DUF1572 domain-containing protein [Gemmatimonadota bacterium]NIU73561.1 DUF1572 domain-containing protein [Gammaproteobacteria bacterium]NIX43759.1 DUF1572 domain-containing protein [Gemmatimonadota bacterium]NIY07955.1 DUF1572 domain-containing protein [Gemmatimonadota bacterium]
REEFDAGRGARGADPGPLLTTLETAVAEAVSVIRRLDPADLDAPLTVQGRSVTVLAAIYHAVEHFSMHLGQILWIAKARTGLDLGLYRDGPDGHPRPSW